MIFLIRVAIVPLLFAISLIVGSASVYTVARADTSDDLYRQLEASSLEILVDGRLSGSGWFASSQGLAFTAAHVVRGKAQVEVVSPLAGRLKAQVMATDLGHDLALLKVERLGEPFRYLVLAEEEATLGHPLHLFGSPLYRQGLMLPGKLAKAESYFEWNHRNHCYMEVIPVSAMTPEGLSGGPWVNEQGQVVGLQSGMMVYRDGLVGIAFMSPLEALDSLLKWRKDVPTLSLGATLVQPRELPARKGSGQDLNMGGVVLQQVDGSGPAGAAGLRQGDRLLSLAGEKITGRDQLLRKLRRYHEGDKVKVEVLRKKGGTDEVMMTLFSRDEF